MQHLLVSTLTLLLVTSSLAAVHSLVEVPNAVDSWEVDNNSTCVCRVVTGWSEMEEYLKVQDMRTRLQDAETIIDSMNFTAIFERLQNMTDRLNSLEDVINSQAIATSVSELFALRKNVEALVNIMEHTNSSAMVYEQRLQLAVELDAISNVTNDIWSRNPYKQREDYKQEVSELRARFSRCHKDVDLSPFAGDSLPLNVSMLDGWCPAEGSLRVGFPLTHRWEDSTYEQRGMWYKDPQPLMNTSTTEVWEMVYKRENTYNRYGNRETKTVSSMKKFPKYASLSINSQSEIVSKPEMTGYGGVVYRNSFYYHYNTHLIKIDLESKVKTTILIGHQSVGYKSPGSETYVDLKVDELGLWVIYSMSSDNKIAISKLDPDTLLIQKTWITGVVKTDVCAAFMVCGRMYTIKSCSTRLTSNGPNYVYDTHTSKGSYSQYHVPSVYGSLTQLTYNPRERLLFGWDKAHMVTYTVGWGGEEE